MSDFARFAALSDFASWPEKMAGSSAAQRLFHGRGQCFAGFEYFTVDYFAPVLWLVLYRAPEPEFWAQFCTELKLCCEGSSGAAIVQSRYQDSPATYCLWGSIPINFTAKEGAAEYLLDLGAKQNIGYFMDMQPARQWLAERAEGKRILNLFAYTCAFSVAAELAGAARLVNVDMSKGALQGGRENHRRNGARLTTSGEAAELKFLSHDILKSWGRLRKLGPYDVVVCDPPSLQRGSFDAVKDYPKLARRFSELMPLGGDVLACLNAPYLDEQFLRETVERHCTEAVFVERLAGRRDFPEQSADRALKVLHFQIKPREADLI
ncbi:MAG: class I SAM-dependent methyltransferase [Zhongshania sp.]|uniref:class I SAM-dependent methyltransferase n=1 Tax=Zhongshania sp. TaxID=1971902 RepID=UPI0026350C77|nr:class I SAM-dependent methyltransferase [Zhongshania sp.]MDF1691617.1 class I SAM-dependent methyltransferase [Zhongshania sp.]